MSWLDKDKGAAIQRLLQCRLSRTVGAIGSKCSVIVRPQADFWGPKSRTARFGRLYETERERSVSCTAGQEQRCRMQEYSGVCSKGVITTSEMQATM